MRKEECVNVFNVKLREFISDLIRVYPTDDDLKKFVFSISDADIKDGGEGAILVKLRNL